MIGLPLWDIWHLVLDGWWKHCVLFPQLLGWFFTCLPWYKSWYIYIITMRLTTMWETIFWQTSSRHLIIQGLQPFTLTHLPLGAAGFSRPSRCWETSTADGAPIENGWRCSWAQPFWSGECYKVFWSHMGNLTHRIQEWHIYSAYIWLIFYG